MELPRDLHDTVYIKSKKMSAADKKYHFSGCLIMRSEESWPLVCGAVSTKSNSISFT